MPIYEYRCGSCGHEIEALQKLSDPALTECPACKAAALTKLVSAAGFQLKGSGWYATDFRSSGKPAAAKTNGEPAAGDAKPETKSEGKSESSSESKGGGSGESKGESKSAASGSAGGCGTSCACH
jgi:putative FmdB family regulatory protein